MNRPLFQRFGVLLVIGSLGLGPALAQPEAPARGGRGAGRGGGGGGGRGAAVSYTPAQTIALASINIPGALTQAATTANNELLRASLSSPANPAELEAKAANAANALLAVGMQLASELRRIEAAGPPLNLTPEQLQSVIANNGLARGGNTSPGGVFPYDDYTGFTRIWDGRTFNGWSGETNVWSIENGAIHSDPTRLPGQHMIHFTGLPGVSPIVRDFDFKVEFATLNTYTGGIFYRSRLLTGHGPNRTMFDPATMTNPLGQPLPAGITTMAQANAAGIAGQPWALSGYQYDISSFNTASLYEQGGGAVTPAGNRGVVVNSGEIVQLLPNGLKFVVGQAQENPMQFLREAKGPAGEWNQVEIIARGNTMVHLLNGKVISVAIDDDPARRALQGILGFQGEGAMIWFRNIYLKHL